MHRPYEIEKQEFIDNSDDVSTNFKIDMDFLTIMKI